MYKLSMNRDIRSKRAAVLSDPETSKMHSKAEKPIKIVKRKERKLTVVECRTPPANPQTPAQIRREMVSTIVSWINDRKRGQRGSHRVVLQDAR